MAKNSRAIWQFGAAFGMILWIAAAASAEEENPAVTSWMSTTVQNRPAAERIQMLADMVKTNRYVDNALLSGVLQKDPDRSVKLAAIAQLYRQHNVKKISRVNDAVHSHLRTDRELLFGIAKTVYEVRGKDSDFKAFVLSSLILWGGSLPWPTTIPASGTVDVEWTPLASLKDPKRNKPQTLKMDAKEATRAREMVTEIVKMFNTLAGTQIQPGPESAREMKEWNDKFGGKTIEAETWLESGIPRLQSTNLAQVVTSGLLGTAGTEWLAGGGFQPDGAIVLAGVTLGPTLDFPGVKAKVIGKDRGQPGTLQRETVLNGKTNQPELVPLRWSHALGTPFLVRLAPDAQRILSVTRLPWGAGGVTSAVVDKEGNIYLAGPARDAMRSVGGDVQDLPKAKVIPPPETKKSPPPPDPDTYAAAYVAKLSSDASRVLWVRLVDNPNQAARPPEITVTAKGQLSLTGPDVRLLTLDGKQVMQWDPPNRKMLPSEQQAVSLTLGLTAYAGEHHSPTGHEPWRCPYVRVKRLDGSSRLTLYDWPGPMVGGAGGLVADSPLYAASFDQNDDLILLGWSDGGNSVLHCEPMDFMKSVSYKGLGMSGAGVAGAMHFGYVVRVSTKTWRAIGGTMLCGFNPKFGPASVSVDEARVAADHSLMLIGTSAWGFPQTENSLLQGHPAGKFIMVLTGDCSMARFSSSMAACGEVEVGLSRWGLVTGTQNGSPMALFVTGAVSSAPVYGRDSTAPALNPLQPSYGGGDLDGHFTLLDLSAHPVASTPVKKEKHK